MSIFPKAAHHHPLTISIVLCLFAAFAGVWASFFLHLFALWPILIPAILGESPPPQADEPNPAKNRLAINYSNASWFASTSTPIWHPRRGAEGGWGTVLVCVKLCWMKMRTNTDKWFVRGEKVGKYLTESKLWHQNSNATSGDLAGFRVWPERW